MFDPSKETFIEKFFKIFDIFGRPIEFTIHGQRTFKTPLGGISALGVFTILGIYLVYKIIGLTEREYDLTNALNTEDLQINKNLYEMDSAEFQMAVVPTWLTGTLKTNNANISEYVSVVYGQEEIVYDNAASRQLSPKISPRERA